MAAMHKFLTESLFGAAKDKDEAGSGEASADGTASGPLAVGIGVVLEDIVLENTGERLRLVKTAVRAGCGYAAGLRNMDEIVSVDGVAWCVAPNARNATHACRNATRCCVCGMRAWRWCGGTWLAIARATVQCNVSSQLTARLRVAWARGSRLALTMRGPHRCSIAPLLHCCAAPAKLWARLRGG